MNEPRAIALDALGGDHGSDVVIPAALQVLREFPQLRLILVGDRSVIDASLAKVGGRAGDRLEIHHASERVEMDDPPSHALRMKKDSSMRVAINLVKEGRADACVSAGNTGALMAISRFVLKTLPGVDRPAIISALPSITGHTYVLDLGANVDCTAQQLFQFAVMGSVLVSAVDNNTLPRVGLLNVGEEEIKGNEQVKEAAALLSMSPLNYIGFVERDDVYTGGVDVVVCDGFVGNVALKTSEGVAKFIAHHVKREFSRNLLTRVAALAAFPVLRALRAKIDARRYNGASLLGLQGIVIKSHGGADAFAFANAIRIAVLEVEKAVPEKIRDRLETLLAERRAG
ncbi:MAG: phosphate acyltransferase PlsX [Gammaproteobacteria bacterium]